MDDLHERAGSSRIIHLHGELKKSRSSLDPALVYDIRGTELSLGDKCEKGSQLRPHIVWFGEAVPLMETAIRIAEEADCFLIVGTSMAVYPAADLVYNVPASAKIYLVDPKPAVLPELKNVRYLAQNASMGVPMVAAELKAAVR